MNYKGLSVIQKVVLFSFLALMTGLYSLIMNIMVLNLGCGAMRYPRLFLQILPALYIIHIHFRKRSLKFPHLVTFLLMIFVFILFEGYFSTGSNSNLQDYQFVWQQVKIYTLFLMLVNFGLDREVFYKVVNYTLYIYIFICFVTIGGYLGFFDISPYENADNIFYASIFKSIRPHHILHTNGVSYMFALTILLLIIKRLKEQETAPLRIFMDLTVVLCLVGLIAVNGSRGALFLALFMVGYYFYFVYRCLPKMVKRFIPFSAGIVFFLVISIYSITDITSPLESTTKIRMIYERFNLRYVAATVNSSTRKTNMLNAWSNFKEHPFTGVGYDRAARRRNLGTRSNNQIFHLTASCGAVFIITYIIFHFRFYIIRLNMLKRPEIILSVIFITVYLSLRRPMDIMAILGYIVYFFYNEREKVKHGKGVIVNDSETQES
jgi:hypothetical protein